MSAQGDLTEHHDIRRDHVGRQDSSQKVFQIRSRRVRISKHNVCRQIADTGLVLTHDDHNLYAGTGGAGSVPGADAPYTVDGAGTLLSSGATYVPPSFDPLLTHTLASPELAFLRLIEDDEFGSKMILKLFGEPGESQLLVGSLVPAAFTVFGKRFRTGCRWGSRMGA